MKMACGLQAAGGEICQLNAVTDVDRRRSPGGRQASCGYVGRCEVEGCLTVHLRHEMI